MELDVGRQRVTVFVEHGGQLTCPVCAKTVPGYDTKRRRWGHLDTWQYHTYLTADVPRVKCPDHGVKQIEVPWADPGSRFKDVFECLVIDWLKEANTAAVARRLGLSWASRCRLKPMVKAGRTVRKHLCGILNAVVLNATNAIAESMNGKIQRIKARACGYRNETGSGMRSSSTSAASTHAPPPLPWLCPCMRMNCLSG